MVRLSDDSSPRECASKGREALNQEHFQEAIQWFNQAIDRSDASDKKPAWFNNRGCAYLGKGDIQLAIKDFTTAIALNDDYFEAHINRARVFEKSQEYSTALSDYKKANELKPSDEVSEKIVQIRTKIHDSQDVVTWINQYLEKAPDAIYRTALQNQEFSRLLNDCDLFARWRIEPEQLPRHFSVEGGRWILPYLNRIYEAHEKGIEQWQATIVNRLRRLDSDEAAQLLPPSFEHQLFAGLCVYHAYFFLPSSDPSSDQSAFDGMRFYEYADIAHRVYQTEDHFKKLQTGDGSFELAVCNKLYDERFIQLGLNCDRARHMSQVSRDAFDDLKLYLINREAPGAEAAFLEISRRSEQYNTPVYSAYLAYYAFLLGFSPAGGEDDRAGYFQGASELFNKAGNSSVDESQSEEYARRGKICESIKGGFFWSAEELQLIRAKIAEDRFEELSGLTSLRYANVGRDARHSITVVERTRLIEKLGFKIGGAVEAQLVSLKQLFLHTVIIPNMASEQPSHKKEKALFLQRERASAREKHEAALLDKIRDAKASELKKFYQNRMFINSLLSLALTHKASKNVITTLMAKRVNPNMPANVSREPEEPASGISWMEVFNETYGDIDLEIVLLLVEYGAKIYALDEEGKAHNALIKSLKSTQLDSVEQRLKELEVVEAIFNAFNDIEQPARLENLTQALAEPCSLNSDTREYFLSRYVERYYAELVLYYQKNKTPNPFAVRVGSLFERLLCFHKQNPVLHKVLAQILLFKFNKEVDQSEPDRFVEVLVSSIDEASIASWSDHLYTLMMEIILEDSNCRALEQVVNATAFAAANHIDINLEKAFAFWLMISFGKVSRDAPFVKIMASFGAKKITNCFLTQGIHLPLVRMYLVQAALFLESQQVVHNPSMSNLSNLTSQRLWEIVRLFSDSASILLLPFYQEQSKVRQLPEEMCEFLTEFDNIMRSLGRREEGAIEKLNVYRVSCSNALVGAKETLSFFQREENRVDSLTDAVLQIAKGINDLTEKVSLISDFCEKITTVVHRLKESASTLSELWLRHSYDFASRAHLKQNIDQAKQDKKQFEEKLAKARKPKRGFFHHSRQSSRALEQANMARRKQALTIQTLEEDRYKLGLYPVAGEFESEVEMMKVIIALKEELQGCDAMEIGFQDPEKRVDVAEIKTLCESVITLFTRWREFVVGVADRADARSDGSGVIERLASQRREDEAVEDSDTEGKAPGW